MSYNKPMNVFTPETAISSLRPQSLYSEAKQAVGQMMRQSIKGGPQGSGFAGMMQEPQAALAAGMEKLQGLGLGPRAGVAMHPELNMGNGVSGGLGKVLAQSASPLRTLSSVQMLQQPAHAGPNQAASKGAESKTGGVATLDAAAKFLGLRGSALNDEDVKALTDVKGILAEKFESGGKGISAIGYDYNGGTSYGKYQIASRPGSMSNFIKYLSDEAPDLAERLKKAGSANTGGRRGKMPEVWQQIAEEQPERFEALQDGFIKKSHFMPALEAIAEKTGIAIDKFGEAFKEVLFSTAVQHGPAGAARIFARAIDRVGRDKLHEDADPANFAKVGENLIKQVYNLRSGQFSSSTPEVQSAVKNRLRAELGEALKMHKTA